MRETAYSLALLLTLLVAACTPGASETDPRTVLRQAGEALAGVNSVAADVRFQPGITYEGLTVTSATTRVRMPSDSDTALKVKQGDLLVEVRVVATGGRVYLKLPFSRFQDVTSDVGQVPDVSRLLNRQSGLAAIMASGRDSRYLGTERMGGVDCDKVSTTYTAQQIGQVLSGVQPAGDVSATVWVGRSDHLLRRVVLKGPLVEAGKDVEVQADLHDFNQPVTITQPS